MRPVPDIKWRFIRVHELSWLPREFARLLNEVLMIRSLDHQELRRRISALERLLEETCTFEEKRGLLPRQLYRYFLQKTQDYEIF